MQEQISNKKPNGPPVEKEMSFWDHLEELRKHLFRSIAVIMVFAVAAFIGKKFIFDIVLLAPKDASFIFSIHLSRKVDLIDFSGTSL